MILVAQTDTEYYQKYQGVFVKHYALGGKKVQKAVFSFKVKVNVINLGVI